MSERSALTRTVRVMNEGGLHMTPCSVLVRLTNGFAGNVKLSSGGREADCKSILDLMLLGAAPGTVLSLTITGEQADAMMQQITRFFENGFEQDE